MNYTYDDASKSYKINVTWTPRLDGSHAYVAEKIGDGFVTEYGPMSPDLVRPLIEERRAYVQKQFDAERDRLLGVTLGQSAAELP